jgi:hypothetical protein
MEHLPLEATDWGSVEEERQPGATGHAISKTRSYADVRVRFIEYTPGYLADHWCSKAHVIYCIAGEISIELDNGHRLNVRKGMSLATEQDGTRHRLSSDIGAVIFVVD